MCGTRFGRVIRPSNPILETACHKIYYFFLLKISYLVLYMTTLTTNRPMLNFRIVAKIDGDTVEQQSLESFVEYISQ